MASQNESRQEVGAQRSAVGILQHGIQGTNRYVIKKLEAELVSRKAKYLEAEKVNQQLRAKEQVLWENVAAQGNTLHFVALAALQEPDVSARAETTLSDMTQSLMQDVEVHRLLAMVGNCNTSAEPYTTRCMRTAFTPERVAAVRTMTLEDVAHELQQMTMKLAVLLQSCAAEQSDGDDSTVGDEGAGTAAPVLSYTVDSMVDAYTELAMLLHVASDKVNLQLGTINLDTLQPQEPPAGHWKRVLGHLQLQPQQISHVCAGFQVYAEKVAPIVSQTHELVRRMHATTGSMLPELQQSTSGYAAGISPDSMVANHHNNMHGFAAKLGGHSSCSAHMRDSPGPASSSNPAQGGKSGAAGAVQGGSSQHAAAGAAGAGEAAGIASPDFSSNSSGSGVKPWQQFGHADMCLTDENAERLDQLLKELLSNIMRLRELHRSVTFMWLNTLTNRQKAISIVKAYPFWTQPLAMCKLLLEEYNCPCL